jgi:repressor LexA
MKPLTDRQQSILDFIQAHLAREGLPPTHEDIARAFGFSQVRAAGFHLQALAQKGVIALQPGKARGIRILRPAPAVTAAILNLPLIGRVAAGQPIDADAHIEREIAIDKHLFRPRPDYLLRVHGMSMRDAGILDRDLIAVHRTSDASNGQIVVARIDGEITVKRLQKSRQRIVLQAENPDFAPIQVDPTTTDFAIEGLYVGVIRLP